MTEAIEQAPSGFQRVDGGAAYPRHRHAQAYAAIVLAGTYDEAGGCGRWSMRPGYALFHEPFDSHRNRFGAGESRILNLPLAGPVPGYGCVRIADIDRAVRLAAHDPFEAVQALLAGISAPNAARNDWPDLLAADLRRCPRLNLAHWGERHGLAPATLSRGFHSAYGVSPVHYRKEARAHRAWSALTNSGQSLSGIALDLGFSDQAHMTRDVRWLTGETPGAWRQTRSRPAGGAAT